MQDPSSSDHLAAQASRPRAGVIREVMDFLAANRKWWLAPIIVALFLVGILVVLGGTSAAPFIYTIF